MGDLVSHARGRHHYSLEQMVEPGVGMICATCAHQIRREKNGLKSATQQPLIWWNLQSGIAQVVVRGGCGGWVHALACSCSAKSSASSLRYTDPMPFTP